jgi:hypothetical protein
MHYFELAAMLQAVCLSNLPDKWRQMIEGIVADLTAEEKAALVECLQRQVRGDTKKLAAKKAALTILTKEPSGRKRVVAIAVTTDS